MVKWDRNINIQLIPREVMGFDFLVSPLRLKIILPYGELALAMMRAVKLDLEQGPRSLIEKQVELLLQNVQRDYFPEHPAWRRSANKVAQREWEQLITLVGQCFDTDGLSHDI